MQPESCLEDGACESWMNLCFLGRVGVTTRWLAGSSRFVEEAGDGPCGSGHERVVGRIDGVFSFLPRKKF